MEDQNNQLSSNQQSNEGPAAGSNSGSSRKNKVLTTFLIILLLGVIGYLGYLWKKEVDNSKGLNSQLSSLNGENASLKDQVAKNNAPKESTKAEYEATVGKFTLTLADPYAIIESLDGDFEGGPATQLTIGQQTDVTNVLDTNLNKKVELTATPLSNGGNTFAQAVKAALSDFPDNKKQTSIAIDKVSAEVYTASGLFESRMIFFSKNGIFYKITAEVDSVATKKVIDDVIAGFKFK